MGKRTRPGKMSDEMKQKHYLMLKEVKRTKVKKKKALKALIQKAIDEGKPEPWTHLAGNTADSLKTT